jgi:hypothetical protein
MKHGWNKQSEWWSSAEAKARAADIRTPRGPHRYAGQKVKITKRTVGYREWYPGHKLYTGKRVAKHLYTVWVWWPWKSWES